MTDVPKSARLEYWPEAPMAGGWLNAGTVTQMNGVYWWAAAWCVGN